jgi:hypothetical protein
MSRVSVTSSMIVLILIQFDVINLAAERTYSNLGKQLVGRFSKTFKGVHVAKNVFRKLYATGGSRSGKFRSGSGWATFRVHLYPKPLPSPNTLTKIIDIKLLDGGEDNLFHNNSVLVGIKKSGFDLCMIVQYSPIRVPVPYTPFYNYF